MLCNKGEIGMKTHRSFLTKVAFVLWASCVIPSAMAQSEDCTKQAKQILDVTGVKGGLIVQIGCSDGKLTAALRADGSYLVHGLDTDAQNVQRAREYIQSLGLYGKVAVDRFDGKRLPYVDNLVNLVVAEDLGDVPMSEVMRVLCPNGVAYIKNAGEWKKTVKPRPKEMDDWTHFLYDATNNAVSHDTAVDMPYHLQWTEGPRWARSHDHLASMSAAVSAGGRLFYIMDEGLTAAVTLPSKWTLIARDGFNGVVLWTKPIGPWEGHLRGFRSGPAELPRRLVAIGQRVFVTLGYGKPVTALDAATGNIAKTYEGTDGTLEIVYANGVLYLVTGRIDLAELQKRRGASPAPYQKRLLAVDADTGAILWEKADSITDELMPLTLAVSGQRVFFENPDAVVCLDAKTGNEDWRASRPIVTKRWGWSTPTLVVYGDVVLSADRASPKPSQTSNEPRTVQWDSSSRGGDAPPGELIAFSIRTGHELWRCGCRETYNAPVDVLVVRGLVWTGNLVSARDPGITLARDAETGEIKMRRPPDQKFFSFGMGHHRCYRNKATENYLLLGRSGVEFIDVTSGVATANHFIRGTCQYGIFPANGLLYTPPHSCACFIEAKLNGFNALVARDRQSEGRRPNSARLEKGPAYGQIENQESKIENPNDWPTYRHDIARSGRTREKIPVNVASRWRTRLGGRLSSPVVADGMVFVSAIDTHTVHAVDADTGAQRWSYTAGGRIDSPPTIYHGLALFGSADGYVYCVRASDGVLVWRFRAAPEDDRIVAYGQVESVWPVPGNVLVLPNAAGRSDQATAWFAAGRSSYLDGGMRLYGLDAETGKVLTETKLDDRDPKTGLPPQHNARGTYMPGALPDVLSSDGQFVYMRQLRFDLNGVEQKPDVPHLFSPAGFLDGSWWHRTYWIYGTKMNSGWGGWPTIGNQAAVGRLLVLDKSMAYGFGRLNQYDTHGSHVGLPASLTPWPPPQNSVRARGTTHYELFACPKEPEVVQTVIGQMRTRRGQIRKRTRKDVKCEWSEEVGVLARAMVLTDGTLFIAGPPDLLTAGPDRSSSTYLNNAEAAYEGKRGALLDVISTSDGAKLAEQKLKSVPVYDGLAAAYGRLYMATTEGEVLCFSGGR
jgi:outer membrane protein assembly factor BamB